MLNPFNSSGTKVIDSSPSKLTLTNVVLNKQESLLVLSQVTEGGGGYVCQFTFGSGVVLNSTATLDIFGEYWCRLQSPTPTNLEFMIIVK